MAFPPPPPALLAAVSSSLPEVAEVSVDPEKASGAAEPEDRYVLRAVPVETKPEDPAIDAGGPDTDPPPANPPPRPGGRPVLKRVK